MNEVPEIHEKIEDGSLSLTNISKAAEKFRQEKITDKQFKKEVINSIENSSTRICDKTLADVVGPGQLKVALTKSLQVINIAVSDEIYSKYDEIRGLLAHHKLSKEEIFEKIFDIALLELKKRKFKTNSKQDPKESSSRYIPAG